MHEKRIQLLNVKRKYTHIMCHLNFDKIKHYILHGIFVLNQKNIERILVHKILNIFSFSSILKGKRNKSFKNIILIFIIYFEGILR